MPRNNLKIDELDWELRHIHCLKYIVVDKNQNKVGWECKDHGETWPVDTKEVHDVNSE